MENSQDKMCPGIPGVLFSLYMAQIGMACAKPLEELTSPDVLYPCMRVLFVKAEATQHCPFHQRIQTSFMGWQVAPGEGSYILIDMSSRLGEESSFSALLRCGNSTLRIVQWLGSLVHKPMSTFHLRDSLSAHNFQSHACRLALRLSSALLYTPTLLVRNFALTSATRKCTPTSTPSMMFTRLSASPPPSISAVTAFLTNPHHVRHPCTAK